MGGRFVLEGLTAEILNRLATLTIICAGTLIGPLMDDDIHSGDKV